MPAKAEPIATQLKIALAFLKSKSTTRDRDNLVRFAINAPKAFGTSMSNIKILAKKLGKNHELAIALWDSGWYEARMLASMVAEPARVTRAQMDAWCRDFDNWGICDTICFCLFDRTPHAWKKVDQWSKSQSEFIKRTAFALLWSLTTHDKTADDNKFKHGLQLIEKAATDDRHFVKKAVNMALRAIGKRNVVLHEAAVATSQTLAASDNPTARWIGKNALNELMGASVARRLAKVKA